MCTVTFIPDGAGGYHLTSNRDEHVARARALPPRRHSELIYPKDATAGGSWVALKRSADAGVLLNGAFVKHRRKAKYRRSRGLVFLDILRAESPLQEFGFLCLDGIEPFTLVLFVQEQLFECRWDGEKKYVDELETHRPHIWSSVTLYCEKGSRIGELRRGMEEKGLHFPLMGKPDIGQRGMGVELLKDECQLLRYAVRSKVPFLLQEYIDYPNEIGVFYYRLDNRGVISGIVGKELLTVTGDGRSTVEVLLGQSERALLQLPVLRRTLGRELQVVPPNGEVLTLAPYGNHSRGAKFVDWSERITPRLSAVIDALCREIPGFYFGRLDIRFRDWVSLERGEAFSVIELNGAGSEPTHIYDPRHSVLFAWREIKRHLDILYRISRENARQQGLSPMRFWQGMRMLRDYSRHEKLLGR